MKVNLKGLFANIVADVRPSRREYNKFCLDEVLGHIQDVVDGKHTIEEFAKHYCLHRRQPIADAPTSAEGVTS